MKAQGLRFIRTSSLVKKSFDNLLAAFSNIVKSSNKLYTKENLKKSKKLKDALDEAELALVNVNKELNS